MEKCFHCGFGGALEQKGEAIQAASKTQNDPHYGDFVVITYWMLYRCPSCRGPTLGRFIWADPFSDPEDPVQRVFPTARNQTGVPENVVRAYDLALLGRATDPAFYAVGLRRTLEAICDDQAVPASTEGGRFIALGKRLEMLSELPDIPYQLSDLMKSLKEIGNLGAHEGGVEIAKEDIPAVADLLDAILEYLYRAPARLDAVRASFAARGVEI